MKEKTKNKPSLERLLRQGLSENKVKDYRRRYGKNLIKDEPEIRGLVIFLSQFKSPLIYILIIAAVITVVLGDYVDTIVIGLAVVVNTILGFYQEYKAQQALAALRSLLSPKAVVLRGGKRQTIDAVEVVPGDICFIGLGEKIPADGLVIQGDDLAVVEAVLSGESVPVHKTALVRDEAVKADAVERLIAEWVNVDSEYKVYAGTAVASGQAVMVVVKTGSGTEVGKIAKSLEETKEEQTPLQRDISKFSNQLAVIVGIVALVIFATGLLAGEGFITIFATSVAIAVAAIPEGMAVSLTVILAIGMQRILKKKALVRKLVAAETLGSVTVICADKTGTLTEGLMRVTKAEFTDEEKGILAAVLTSDQKDPLEVAMWDWVEEIKKRDPERILNLHERLDSIPFSPEEKFSAKLFKDGVYLMGAPEVVLSFCRLPGAEKFRWLRKFNEYGLKGLRIVGFAYRPRKQNEKVIGKKGIKQGLQWLGILVYEDPVREGVAEVLSEVKRAGIAVKVITGDYRATAEGVLESLGLITHKDKLNARQPLVIEGEELEMMSEEELRHRVKDTVLFTRINPVNKLKIVRALQANGEIVAMTGDGVNDAPALKKANIGIVVSGATDVAKETADMVLMDDDFSTIAAAVEEGRGIFDNLRKVILYLLSDSFAEVIMVMGSLFLGIPLPLTASQILWINLITDGFPSLALTIEPKDEGLMRQKPRDRDGELVDFEIRFLIGLISLVTGVLTLAGFFWIWKLEGEVASARTVAFSMLSINTLLYVFSARSLRKPIWQTNLLSNRWLVATVFIGFMFQIAALYNPFLQRLFETRALTAFEWMLVAGEAMLVISLIEMVKWRFTKIKLARGLWTLAD